MGRRKKTNVDYRAENIAAARIIVKGRKHYAEHEPLTLEWAELTLKRYGVPEVAPTTPPETVETHQRYATARKSAQQNIFDGRAAACGKDE